MSQPMVSSQTPVTHGTPAAAADARHARRVSLTLPSSPGTLTAQRAQPTQHHASPSQDLSTRTRSDVRLSSPTTSKRHGVGNTERRRLSCTSQATSASASPDKDAAQAVRPSPASMTRLGPAPMGNSLSSPTVARQHILQTTPVAVVGSGKRNSTSLLASTADAARTAKNNKLPPPVQHKDSLSTTSIIDGLRPPSTESSSSNSSGSSRDCNVSSQASEACSCVSSIPTTTNASETSSSTMAAAAARTDDAFNKSQDSRTVIVESPSFVSSQPPAPPSMATKAEMRHKEEFGGPEHNIATCASATLPCPAVANGNDDPAPPAEFESQCYQPPTIEQRDALARRVYAACQAAGYVEWTQLLDMAPLASQHHLSGYNCIKFGQEGSPYAYLPFSLQQPMQANELMEKQKQNEASALTWLAQKRAKQRRETSTDNDDVCIRDTSPTRGVRCRSCIAECKMALDDDAKPKECECGPLRNEAVLTSEWETSITAEASDSVIAAPPPPARAQIPSAVQVKTSDTHPISISPIIPQELLADISVHVYKGLSSSISGEAREGTLNHFDSQTTDAAHHALQIQGSRLIRCRMTKVELSEVAFRAERELIDSSQEQRRPRTLVLRDPVTAEPTNDVVRDVLDIERAQDPSGSHDACGDNDMRSSSPYILDQKLYCETRCQEELGHDDDDLDPCMLRDSDMTYGEGNGEKAPPTIGNLLLSSCPGKKVRLTGPVRGRGAICRDLGLDLLRVRQMGVEAIVCCLDDEELGYLGAPWHEYEREADRLGIEVVRLPMAEGFSPTDIVAADKAIGCVVNDYTLRGLHVLVHCRGGVGRAGLIACMWMLKLGLVRSDRDEVLFRLPLPSLVTTSVRHRRASNTYPGGNAKGYLVESPLRMTGDVMQTVHRLIETIRRRRSPKAIETAEQVQFLVRYLTYLKDLERQRIRHIADALTSAA